MKNIQVICNAYEHTHLSSCARSFLKYLIGKAVINIPTMSQTNVPGIINGSDNVDLMTECQNNVQPDISLFIDSPLNWGADASSRNIGVLSWPTSYIPNAPIVTPNQNIHPERLNFVRTANTMNEIWVFSKWVETIARLSGITVPIQVIKPILDTNYWSPEAPEIPKGVTMVTHDLNGNPIEKDKRPFVVGMICDWSRRTNMEAFIASTLVSLPHANSMVVLKIQRHPSAYNEQVTKDVMNMVQSVKASLKLQPLPNVIIIDELYSEEEIRGLIQTFDVYVSTSRGEGVDYNVIQSMAMGKIVIAPKCSWYSTEIIPDVNGIPIMAVGEVVRLAEEPWHQGNQRWGVIDEIGLSQCLNEIYKNRHDPALKALRESARKYAVNNYGTQISGGKVSKLLALNS
jgi:glycosyltransferase involved in cell wall biosynthesis